MTDIAPPTKYTRKKVEAHWENVCTQCERPLIYVYHRFFCSFYCHHRYFGLPTDAVTPPVPLMAPQHSRSETCGYNGPDEPKGYLLPFDTETSLLAASNGFPVAIGPSWQVAFDKIQWILQNLQGLQWRDRAFCRSRVGLEMRIGALVGEEHQAAVAHLPDSHPSVAAALEPKWYWHGASMRLDHLRGSPSARGECIRAQVLAQQHLPNPLTIELPNGTTTRVWLATGKDGKKIIGDALWWGVNCAGKAETPIEVVSSPETAAPDDIQPGPTPLALQGDDYTLTYDANGYPELPACLDRRPEPEIEIVLNEPEREAA